MYLEYQHLISLGILHPPISTFIKEMAVSLERMMKTSKIHSEKIFLTLKCVLKLPMDRLLEMIVGSKRHKSIHELNFKLP